MYFLEAKLVKAFLDVAEAIFCLHSHSPHRSFFPAAGVPLVLRPSTLFEPTATFKKLPSSDTPHNRPGGVSQSTPPRVVPKWHLRRFLTTSVGPKRFQMTIGPSFLHRFPLGAAVSRSAFNKFWDPFLDICLTLFRTPQNLDFAIPYSTF